MVERKELPHFRIFLFMLFSFKFVWNYGLYWFITEKNFFENMKLKKKWLLLK